MAAVKISIMLIRPRRSHLAIVLAIRTLLTHGWESVREDLITGVEQAAARNPDPQTHQVVEFLKSPQGIVLLLIMVAEGE